MKKTRFFLCLTVTLCALGMVLVDGIWKPPYVVKSLVKLLLFLSVPLVFSLITGLSPGKLFLPDKKALTTGALLGGGTFCVILVGYYLLKDSIDFSAVPASLMENGGITAGNFLYVSIYIALCNSLLEEFFFRGFAFLTLKKLSAPSFAYCFSAAAFAVYHAGILDGWFSPLLYGLMLLGLFVCGLFFNYLDARRQRIWVSWLTHMGANLGINLIGMLLLGIF